MKVGCKNRLSPQFVNVSQFFDQMNLLLNWSLIEMELKKYYSKGVSVAGRPSYSGLLLFKISLLQTWYGLSDYEVEERINDSLIV